MKKLLITLVAFSMCDAMAMGGFYRNKQFGINEEFVERPVRHSYRKETSTWFKKQPVEMKKKSQKRKRK